MGKDDRDDVRSCTKEEGDCTFIHARGTQLEQVAPVHFVKSSMSPAHLHMRLSWRNMVCHAHASKMLLSKRWKYLLKRRSHRRRMDVRLRPCREDMSPSHRSPLDRYAATPPTRWTRKPREAGVIYENETTIEETPFIIPLKSFRVHSLQEPEIRVVVRYGTVMTAGELTRHISADYGTNSDLYLMVNGTPLEDSDKVSSDYRQQILLKTRLRGGMRRSSRAPAKLDVTKELCTIRQREPLNDMGQQEEDRQARIMAELRKLRHRMWLQYHPLRTEVDRLLSATRGPISEDDLKNLHHLSTDCSTRPLLQRGLFCQGGCRYTGMGDPCPNQIPEWMRTGEGGPTEVAKGLAQDPTATYLKATQGVPKGTLLAAFGEVSIIRASEPEGVQLGDLYDQIQKSQSGDKCQYTVKVQWAHPPITFGLSHNQTRPFCSQRILQRSLHKPSRTPRSYRDTVIWPSTRAVRALTAKHLLTQVYP